MTITEVLAGNRIDKVLSKETEFSRGTIQRLVEEEKILVNGKKVKCSYKVLVGDEITFDCV